VNGLTTENLEVKARMAKTELETTEMKKDLNLENRETRGIGSEYEENVRKIEQLNFNLNSYATALVDLDHI